MRTIHYVSMTADGYVVEAQSAQDIPANILEDLMGLVAQCGAIAIGRRTYDLFQAAGAIGMIPGVVVVLSKTLSATEGVQLASSAEGAVARLSELGIPAVVIAGGPQTYSAFRRVRMFDELHLNIVPALAGAGLQLTVGPAQRGDLEHLSTRPLGHGVIQLHYRSR